MENKLSLGKKLLLIFFMLITLAGLFGILCGGFFTVGLLISNGGLFTGGPYDWSVISVPSFIGGIIFFIVGRKFYKKNYENNIGKKLLIKQFIFIILLCIFLIGGLTGFVSGILGVIHDLDYWATNFRFVSENIIVILVSLYFLILGFILLLKVKNISELKNNLVLLSILSIMYLLLAISVYRFTPKIWDNKLNSISEELEKGLTQNYILYTTGSPEYKTKLLIKDNKIIGVLGKRYCNSKIPKIEDSFYNYLYKMKESTKKSTRKNITINYMGKEKNFSLGYLNKEYNDDYINIKNYLDKCLFY